MFFIGLKSVRHYKALFIGAFLTMALGVTLIGVSALSLAAVLDVPSTESGPSVAVIDGSGGAHSIYRDAVDMRAITTVLALSAIVSGFMTVMVVASTFAFSIALRRRDLGLLRLLGTAGGQVRRMVLAEALVAAIPAAAVGCLAAALIAPSTLDALNYTTLTPVRLPEHGSLRPLILAYAVGLLLALLAALAASRRAARVRPAEALRDATLDARVMTLGRWVAGLVALAVGAVMTSRSPSAAVANSTALAIFGTIALTIAATTLGPVYLPWLVRLCGNPARWASTASGRLAVASVATSRRRTSSLAAPALGIVAMSGIMLGILQTTDASNTADQLARTRAQLVVESAAGTGLDAATLQRIATAPGVRAVSAPAPLKLVFGTANSDAGQLVTPVGSGLVAAEAADLTSLAAVTRLDVVEGVLGPLTGNQIAVRGEFVDWYGVHAGSTLRLGLFDGRVVTATIAVILNGGADLPQIIVSPALAKGTAGPPPAATILLDSTPADLAAAQLSATLGTTVRVTPVAQWYANHAAADARLQQLVLVILSGPASAFALVAIANTLVMAFSRRDREIASLILLGVTPGQVRRMVVLEALLVTGLGLGVAAIFLAIGLHGYHTALSHSFLATQVQLPWQELIGLAAACLATATVTSLIAVGRILRRPAMAMVVARE